MKFTILISLLTGNSALIPIDKDGLPEKDIVALYMDSHPSDDAGPASHLAVLNGTFGGDASRNGTVGGMPDRNIIALSCALTLLGAYLLFVILYFLYVAIKGSGRVYVRLDPEGGRSAWERAKEQLSDKASSASRGIIQSVEKGKEKAKQLSHGKPVLYPSK